MRDRCENLVSLSFNFTYTSLQGTVLEEKCLVFLLITNSIKNIWSRCATAVTISLFSPIFTYNMLQREVLEKKSLVFC